MLFPKQKDFVATVCVAAWLLTLAAGSPRSLKTKQSASWRRFVFAVEAVWGRGAGACCGCFGARGAGRAGLQQQRVGLEAVELQLQCCERTTRFEEQLLPVLEEDLAQRRAGLEVDRRARRHAHEAHHLGGAALRQASRLGHLPAQVGLQGDHPEVPPHCT